MPQKNGKQPPRSFISKGLEHTFHAPGSTALQQLLMRTPGKDAGSKARALVLRILDGPCTEKLKPSGPMASIGLVKANGSINQNLHGAWVFTYDQRMPVSKWDELTVLCRGLLVLFPRNALLAEGFPETDLQPGVRLSQDHNALLRQLCTSKAEHPCRIIEPLAKFWEGGHGSGELSYDDIVQACSGVKPRLVRIEEKVDGNLGLLYPQMDDDLNPVFDALPLLCTKGIAHSPDIERQMQMLAEFYPAMRLSPDVSHVIVEVVDVEMKIVVPYEEQHTGARLIAAHSSKHWLAQDSTDELARAWSMPRPHSRPLPEDRKLETVKRLAAEYSPAPGELVDEGFVVHLENLPSAETIRIKVHTRFWDVVHDWWEGRISVSSVMPVLTDRIFANSIKVIEPCLVKYKGSGTRRHKDDFLVGKFRMAVAIARRALDESLTAWAEAFADTAALPKGLQLKERLDEFVSSRQELSKEQRGCLSMCVLRMRGDKTLGLHEPVDPHLVSQFPLILRQVFDQPNTPEAAPEGHHPLPCGVMERLSQDAPLAAAMAEESWAATGRKLIEAWAAAAQLKWDVEMMEATLDAAPEAALPELASGDGMLPTQCIGEAGRDHLKQYISESSLASQIMEQINGDGYAVLPGILLPQEADVELARAWDFIETVSPGVKRDDRNTWWANGNAPDPWPCAQRDMFQLHQAGWLFTELREMLADRVFEPLYGTNALHCSKDGFTFQRPTAREDLKRTPNDHFDQGMRWMGLQCIQGSVALSDQSPNDGCFQVWPGSWRLRERLLRGRPPAKGREDFLILSDQERQFLQHTGIEPRRVPVKKGDVILWRSDVAHCGGPPLGRCDTYRLVAYVCCLPAALTPEGVYEQKRVAYEQLESGGHWTNREEWFKVSKQHTRIAWRPYFKEPPELTMRQRQLYGLDRYERAVGKTCPVSEGTKEGSGFIQPAPFNASSMVTQVAIGTLHYVEEAVYKAHKALIAAKFNGVMLKEQKFDIVKDMHKPNFLIINPPKKVPFLETDKGVIFTSNAIARYIARCRADTSLYGDCFDDEGEIDTWLEFAVHELEVPLATMTYPVLGLIEAPPAEITSAAEKDVKSALSTIEGKLKMSPFLIGSFVSLADIALVCALREGMMRVLDEPFRKPYPKLCAWFETCCKMAQFKAVLGETKLCSNVQKPIELKHAPPARKEGKAKAEAAPKKEAKKEAAAKKEDLAKKETAPAPTPAPTAATSSAKAEIETKIKAVGEEIRAIKTKLTGQGLKASEINVHPEIKDKVEVLQELKKEHAAAGDSAPSGNTPTSPPAAAKAPAAGGCDLAAQITAKGNEIRELKAQKKAEGLSSKKVDADEEVKKLVAELQELKAKQAEGGAAAAPAPAPAPAPASAPALAPAAAGGNLDVQIKAKGDEIRELKAQKKASGLSGKKVDADEEVKKLVAELQELKAKKG